MLVLSVLIFLLAIPSEELFSFPAPLSFLPGKLVLFVIKNLLCIEHVGIIATVLLAIIYSDNCISPEQCWVTDDDLNQPVINSYISIQTLLNLQSNLIIFTSQNIFKKYYFLQPQKCTRDWIKTCHKGNKIFFTNLVNTLSLSTAWFLVSPGHQ